MPSLALLSFQLGVECHRRLQYQKSFLKVCSQILSVTPRFRYLSRQSLHQIVAESVVTNIRRQTQSDLSADELSCLVLGDPEHLVSIDPGYLCESASPLLSGVKRLFFLTVIAMVKMVVWVTATWKWTNGHI